MIELPISKLGLIIVIILMLKTVFWIGWFFGRHYISKKYTKMLKNLNIKKTGKIFKK